MVAFEIDPLDINLAKIQFALINDFQSKDLKLPLDKQFENHDPTLKIDTVKLHCFYKEEHEINLEVEVVDIKKDKKYFYTLKTGDKNTILEYLQTQTFLFAIKELVLEISKNS